MVARPVAALAVTKQGSPTPSSAPATTALQRPPVLQVRQSSSRLRPYMWTKLFPLGKEICFPTVWFVLYDVYVLHEEWYSV